MKFCKRYQEYMQRYQDRLPGLSYLHLKKFKKILKGCSFKYHKQADRSFALDEESSSGELSNSNAEGDGAVIACHTSCPVCDGTFFPSLLAEMDAVVCCFNERVKQLLELHLASGFRKYLVWIRSKMGDNRLALIQEGRDLVSYASINALAIRKIVKKYDKVHHSKQGREFRTRAQTMHMEILQSPWLNELIALHINLINSNSTTAFVAGDCSLIFDGGKPSLSCTLLDSLRLDIELTCSICLDTLFDPVSLKCGHIFCYSCACSAASVTMIEGLKEADCTSKCPICRQPGVYKDAVHLVELSMLLSKSCEKYWEQRLQRERVERLQQAKEHWENQCRAFMGL